MNIRDVKRFMFGTLRGRLILGVAVVHAVMMTLFIADLTFRQRAILLDRQEADATALSQSLSTSAAAWLAADDIAGLQELVEAQRRYPELIFAILTDEGGRILAHTDNSRMGQFLLDLPAEVRQAAISKTPVLVDVAVPSMLGGRHVGWARVGIGQKAAQEKLAEITLEGALYALAAILTGSIIAWLMGRRITRRLYAVQDTINKVRTGDQTARSAIAGTDEAASIASEFNAMLDALAEREVKLSISEENFRRLIEESPLAIAVTAGSHNNVELINNKFTALFGYTKIDIPDMTYWWPLAYPEEKYRAAVSTEWSVRVEKAVRTSGPMEPMEAIVICKDGSQRHIEFHMSSVGEKALTTFIDITERKQAEVALQAAFKYTRSLIEASLDPLVTISPEGRIMDVNTATELATGVGRSSLIGSDFCDYFTEPEKAREGYQFVLVQGWVKDYPLSLRHISGRAIDVLYNAAVYKNDEGVLQGVFAAARDITGRKKAEEELTRLNQKNEMILNSAGEGIYGTDIEGNIMFMNPAAQEMLGFKKEDVIGKNSHKIFHHTRVDGTAYPLEECPLHRSLKEGKTYRGQDEVFLARDGRMFIVEHVNTPLIEDGRVIGAVVVFRDITQRRKAEEEIRKLNEDLEQRVAERTAELETKGSELTENQMALVNIVEDLNEKTVELEQANAKLQELDRLKSMFVASMSHELRTPLNSIIGFASIMVNEWAGPLTAEQKENLSAILRAGKHLLSLINDVIDVSKIETGSIESVAEDFEVRDVVIEAVETLRKDIEKKGLTLEIETISRPLRADRRRLLQGLLNLLSNAVKFTDKGSISISVTISDDGRFIEFHIKDTGIGIQSEDLKKLFLPFVRIISPMRPVVPGTGLGLYLTRKITREVLKGDILVRSVYGQGSRFTLKMPLIV